VRTQRDRGKRQTRSCSLIEFVDEFARRRIYCENPDCYLRKQLLALPLIKQRFGGEAYVHDPQRRISPRTHELVPRTFKHLRILPQRLILPQEVNIDWIFLDGLDGGLVEWGGTTVWRGDGDLKVTNESFVRVCEFGLFISTD
jgi:hypothetical protein